VKTRRVRRVALNPRIVVDLMIAGTDGLDVVANQLPEGTDYLLATWDPVNVVVWLIVEHESFDAVAEGAVMPEHPSPVFTRRERVLQ
jgi:hypothetical protein